MKENCLGRNLFANSLPELGKVIEEDKNSTEDLRRA
jgi:hypothetical protein